MNIDQNSYSQNQPKKCIDCQTFYGSQANNGLCSGCFKKTKSSNIDSLKKQNPKMCTQTIAKAGDQLPELKQQAAKEEQTLKQIDRKKCFNCKKKVGLLGIQCKCGYVFCNSHRLPEQHFCSFNHKKLANQRLQESLIKVCPNKITQI